MTQKEIDRRIYAIVKRIPKGYVMSYGQIAAAIGMPRHSRMVGAAMRRGPAGKGIPYHRVLFSDGSLSDAFLSGGEHRQYELLCQEGVSFSKNLKVEMKRHRY
ncbi:MAG: MGMT family protein [Lactobacillales bacterium]|jgi:methylated-DNA-protein-cysteine methyltransferase-like protein|nr:MGMT family protein [Lactobacillales bacterium]